MNDASQGTERTKSILIVEDEAVVGMDLSQHFESHGYEVVGVVGKPGEVLPAVQRHRPSVVLMDVRLRGDVDGITLAEEVFVCEDTPVVFLSAFSDRELVRRGARSGAYAYLTKPVTMAALVATVEMAIQKHEDLRVHRSEAAQLHRALDAMDLAVVGIDARGDLRFMNRAAVELTGSAVVEAMGETPVWLKELDRCELGDAQQPVSLHVKEGPTDVLMKKFRLAGGGSVCLVRPRGGGAD
jgi:DNA-binding response OmpR family regulator